MDTTAYARLPHCHLYEVVSEVRMIPIAILTLSLYLCGLVYMRLKLGRHPAGQTMRRSRDELRALDHCTENGEPSLLLFYSLQL